MGYQLLKEAATKTNDVAGDALTTATVLAQSIVNEGLKKRDRGRQPYAPSSGALRLPREIVQAICHMAMPAYAQGKHRPGCQHFRRRQIPSSAT